MRVAVEATGVSAGGGLSFLRGALDALGKLGRLEIDVFVQPMLANESFGFGVQTRTTARFRGLAHRMAWIQCVFPRRVSSYDAIFAPGNLIPLLAADRSLLFVQNAHVLPQPAWRAEYGSWKRRLQRLMARMSIRRAGRVLFISETMKRWALPYWASNPLEPTVAYPGVTLAVAASPVVRSERDVLVVGNLVPHKRVDLAVQAFAALTRIAPRSGRLCIAGGEGTPGLMRSLEASAERAGIADRVEFLGFVGAQALARAYARSSCYLSTSALEAFPLPPLEAMAAGIPTVVPDASVFREVCDDTAVYHRGDANAIARRLAEVLDGHISEDLSRASRKRAGAFSWPAFAETVGAAFDAIAGGSSSGSVRCSTKLQRSVGGYGRLSDA